MDSKIVAKRVKSLRENLGISQGKLASHIDKLDQPSVYRYERGLSFPPYHILMGYADFFDVSLDYIYGRTDNPQGKQYDYIPKTLRADAKMREFLEMCFDPNSSANAKLKDSIFKIMSEVKDE